MGHYRSDPVATLGILPDDLTFYLSMHQVSPNEAIQSGFEFWPSEIIDATGEELMGLALPTTSKVISGETATCRWPGSTPSTT